MTENQRGWIVAQLERLDELAAARDHRALEAQRGEIGEAEAREARESFLRALEMFAQAVAAREPVLGCVIGHEGLVLASAGALVEPESVAATAQVWLAAASVGAERIGLGPLGQLVVVGATMKIALFQTGGMAVAILAAADAELAPALFQP